MSAPAAPAATVEPDLDDRGRETLRLGQALAALRIFFGVILFANGVAKLFSFTDISVGPYEANLIDRGLARSILENEAARTELPLIDTIATEVLLPNWGFFEWVITFMELGVGALLIVGLATRGAALLGLGQQLFLAGLYFSSNRWAFEQPHEYVPLMILAIVPAGRVWGLDGRVIARRPQLRRWPF
jgi:uncharacterized membrane protein YphA (DoxX/SURF4 family)